MLHVILVRHRLPPGELWRIPRGEQLLLLASMEFGFENEVRAMREVKTRHG